MTVMLAAVCPGDYWTLPHGSWLVEPLTHRTREEEKQSCHSVSVVFLFFFVLIHGLL